MKKINKVVLVLLSLSLASCGFVNYVEPSSSMEQSIIDELSTQRNEYISKLDELYNESNYEEQERRVFVSSIIEAKAQINECNNLDELKTVFDANCEIIGAIKTKQQYAQELADKKTEYVTKIKEVSSEDVYRDKEKEIYNFYIEEATKAFNDITSIKSDFEKLYLAYKGIIEAIKTDADYLIEEANAFEAYKLNVIDEIEKYLNLDDYRETETNAIKAILESATANIKDAVDYDTVDNLVRKYKTDVHDYETDAELYAKELATLIDSSKTEISGHLNINNYRDNEVEIINTLIESFKDKVESLTLKEEVAALLDSYKEILDSIKTDAILYEEEKQLLVDTLFDQLKTIVDYDNLLDEDKHYHDVFCETLRLLSTKEEVETAFFKEKMKKYEADAIGGDSDALIQYQLCLVESLKSYLDKTLYREAQQQEIDSIINNGYGIILPCPTYSDTMTAFNSVKDDLDAVLTNDEVWELEDAQFLSTLHALYGDDILIPEGSLTEANNYAELANIIDYYAFYQLDSSSFLRSTFRVKTNFDLDKSASYIKNKVYWYCKLINHAVGLTCAYDKGSDNQLLITLTPYDMASIDRTESPTLKVSEHNHTAINVNYSTDYLYDDSSFEYLAYEKSLAGIWNTQQLWYALDKKYIPICVPDSAAEESFEAAKAILKSIVSRNMTDAEKNLAIYDWLIHNVYFDYTYAYMYTSSNMDEYPDENISKLRSFYAEGVFIDGMAVCAGYSKAQSIMFSMLGINTIHIVSVDTNAVFEKNAINTVSVLGYHASHEYVLVEIEGKYYFSDPLKSHTYDSYKYVALSFPTKGSGCYRTIVESNPICHNETYQKLYFEGLSTYIDSSEKANSIIDKILETDLGDDYVSIYLPNNQFYDLFVRDDLYIMSYAFKDDLINEYFIFKV